jgi:ApbE superfamily uncharacterized protein (UPF0280 family)
VLSANYALRPAHLELWSYISSKLLFYPYLIPLSSRERLGGGYLYNYEGKQQLLNDLKVAFNMYQPRTYRHWIKDKDLVSFSVTVKETDLYIRARRNLETEALRAVVKCRTPLEEYIKSNPLFLCSLEPYPVQGDSPAIVRDMAQAARTVGVGPMAAVAGAVAEAVGKELLAHTPEVIVENGGDIFMKVSRTSLIGIYANDSPLTGKIALEIKPGETPLGICTSSGTVGHSLSFGTADAVIILSPSTALADAAATAIGNSVKTAEDITAAIEKAQIIDGLAGVVIIKDDNMGMWGKVKLVSL